MKLASRDDGLYYILASIFLLLIIPGWKYVKIFALIVFLLGGAMFLGCSK
jgi:hypothetical protein